MNTDLNYWEARAKEGIFVSASLKEHFANVVEAMEMIGADRQGSEQVAATSGQRLIVDVYVLPGGTTLRAGYENPF